MGEGTQPPTPVTAIVQSKGGCQEVSKPWHSKKLWGNATDQKPSAGKADGKTSTNA